MKTILTRVILIAILTVAGVCYADDWPCFRGPQRDGISAETGLLKSWPAAGPRMLWSADGLGIGFASAAIADGSVYTTGLIGKTGYLFAWDTKGHLKYRIEYGPEWTRSYKGTRTTPLIDGDKLYLFSGLGVLSCREAATGKQIWAVDTLDRFQARNIRWGMACTPLIRGDRIIVTPGGKKGLMVALDKNTGRTIWAATGCDETSAYSSPMSINCGKSDILVTMIQKSVIGVNADTGQLCWHIPYPASYDTSVLTPVVDGRRFFVANVIENDFKVGGTQFEVSPDGSKVQQRWNQPAMDTHHGGDILVDGYLYGSTFDTITSGKWACVRWDDGKLMYKYDWHHDKGSIIYADGMFYCYTENEGNLALVRPTPQKFDIVSSFKIEKGSGQHWAHPSISDGVLYIRHGDSIMAFDIKQK